MRRCPAGQRGGGEGRLLELREHLAPADDKWCQASCGAGTLTLTLTLTLTPLTLTPTLTLTLTPSPLTTPHPKQASRGAGSCPALCASGPAGTRARWQLSAARHQLQGVMQTLTLTLTLTLTVNLALALTLTLTLTRP